MYKPSELKAYLYLEAENYAEKTTQKYLARDTNDALSKWTEVWDRGIPWDPPLSGYYGADDTGMAVQGSGVMLGIEVSSNLYSNDGGNIFVTRTASILNTVPYYYRYRIKKFIGVADHESGPIAVALGFYDTYPNTLDFDCILVSRDGGRYYGEPQPLPPSPPSYYGDHPFVILATKLQNNGILHVVIQESWNYDHAAWYYTKTEDLGVTWSPYIKIKDNGDGFYNSDPPYEGSPYGTGAWFTYHSPAITVNGDKIAVTAMEGFKNYTYEAGWNYPQGYLGNITYDQTITATYQRNDFIICTSMDGGETWNPAVRILNDENPDRVRGGGTRSWGGAAYYNPGGLAEYVSIGLGSTIYYPWGYSSLAVGAYGDDLYLVSSLYETYKRMGGDTNWGLVTSSYAYGPTYSWVYLWYKIPGWTGTPIRGTVANPGNTMHQLAFVNDEDGETFIVIHGNETELFELFFNGEFTYNTVVTSDYFIPDFNYGVRGTSNRATLAFPHSGLSSGFAYLF